jgi:hypothetical protein
MEAKIQVVSQYLVLGNMALVSSITGVPHQLIRAWKAQPWWKDVENQVRSTENIQMDTKLSKIVDKSLDAVLDRVENGEAFFNQKTGKIERRPANLRDVSRVGVDFLSKRELLRGNATERKEVTQVSVDEQLKALALEFARWQSPPKQEVVDVEAKVVQDIGISNQVLDDAGPEDSGDMDYEEEDGDGDVFGELGSDSGIEGDDTDLDQSETETGSPSGYDNP